MGLTEVEIQARDAHRVAEHFRTWARDIRFGDWRFEVHLDDTRPYLQIQVRGDNSAAQAGLDESWTSRKWFLSPYMTKSEFVQTAFLAVMTAMEHETRERFRYKGHAVFGPHYNVERLVDLLRTGDAKEHRDLK